MLGQGTIYDLFLMRLSFVCYIWNRISAKGFWGFEFPTVNIFLTIKIPATLSGLYRSPTCKWASLVALVGRDTSAHEGSLRDMGSIPELGRAPRGGPGNPLQYSCLENPMDREAWQAIVYGVTKSRTQLKWLSMHARACKQAIHLGILCTYSSLCLRCGCSPGPIHGLAPVFSLPSLPINHPVLRLEVCLLWCSTFYLLSRKCLTQISSCLFNTFTWMPKVKACLKYKMLTTELLFAQSCPDLVLFQPLPDQ